MPSVCLGPFMSSSKALTKTSYQHRQSTRTRDAKRDAATDWHCSGGAAKGAGGEVGGSGGEDGEGGSVGDQVGGGSGIHERTAEGGEGGGEGAAGVG